MKSQTQEEIVLKELNMAKEIIETDKEGLKHHQQIIIKANEKIDFRNTEIKAFRNEQLNLYEKLKGVEEVLHQCKEELNIQLTIVENVQEFHHKDWKLLVAKEKKLWKELQVAKGSYLPCKLLMIEKVWPLKTKQKQHYMMNSSSNFQ